MKRHHLYVAAGLVLVLGVAISAGYHVAPNVVSAAQRQAPGSLQQSAAPAEATPSATLTPRANAKAKPMLGVQVTDGANGATIASVVPGGPAEKAGLQTGDTITTVNGTAISDTQQLVRAIGKLQPGDKASLTIQRNGTNQTIDVTLDAQPVRPAPGNPKGIPNHPVLPNRPAPVPNPLDGIQGLVPDLRDVPGDQRFDHFQGGSFSFTDKNGAPVTVTIVPGILTVVTTDTLTLRPNGANADTSYQIVDSTRIMPGGRVNLTQNLKVGDKVVVTGRQGSADADAVYDVTPRTPKQIKPSPQAPQRQQDQQPGQGQPPRGRLFPNGFDFSPGQFGSQFRQDLDQIDQLLRQFRQGLRPQTPAAGL